MISIVLFAEMLVCIEETRQGEKNASGFKLSDFLPVTGLKMLGLNSIVENIQTKS